ncbi:anti-sigma factor [Spongiactinospora sp. TRM90649]|uniref:anti-sigma factor n=1 Tax=Spongiactinospora sp. TRM90649 TaxID=3031114 RepID=UPI0023F61838|nr:anti-sigma factor [Spongiactinospora sp. TRM90649]MDF5752837.1 anti-sigma factor [Spongiactinospora sp. TRM90649]
MRAAKGGFDPHTLVGAYALDAIDDDVERRRFERHLTGCEECAREIGTLMEAAARLGAAVATAPPPGLRARVMSEVGRVRQAPPAVPGRRGRPRARAAGWRGWAAGAVAAALVAAVAVLGTTTIQTRGELAQARLAGQRIAEVLTARDARTVTTKAGTARGTVVVSRSRGAMVFWTAGLPDPPAGRVYQVWRLAPGRVTSAGLLTSGGPLPAPAEAGVDQIGVTVEPAGGSELPTTTPLLLMDLPV